MEEVMTPAKDIFMLNIEVKRRLVLLCANAAA